MKNIDEDGDIVPRSVLLSSYSARQWDKYKTQKYGGKQRAPNVYNPEWIAPIEPKKESFLQSLKKFFGFKN